MKTKMPFTLIWLSPIILLVLMACQVNPSRVQSNPAQPSAPEPRVYTPILSTTQTTRPLVPTPLPNQSGPWQQDLDIVLSEDGGNNFGTAKVLVERAGVPSMIRDAQGRLILVFQWFPNNSPDFDQVAVMFSTDNGTSWSAPKSIVVNGFPSNQQRPFDPTIVQLPDGRYRLYYSSSVVTAPAQQNKPATYSAISNDGVVYEFEPEARFEGSGRVIDPAVIIHNGLWHFVAPVGAPQEGAYHAVSANGLYFARHANIASVNNVNWTGNLVSYENGIRFYGSPSGTAASTWWSYSADGYVWSDPAFVNVRGGDPAIAPLGGKRYAMVYVSPKRR